MQNVTGIHHITVLASDAKANVAFYTRVLGLKLIKRTINFDAPEVYHLYYGDDRGTPGTVLTFFPYAGLQRGRAGAGQVTIVRWSAPVTARAFWEQHLTMANVVVLASQTHFGEEVLAFTDPDGMAIEIVFTDGDIRIGQASEGIAQEDSLRGFHSALLTERRGGLPEGVLLGPMGYKRVEEIALERGGTVRRYEVGEGGPGTYVDIAELPEAKMGLQGAGTVHHLAFRAPDDAAHVRIRSAIARTGQQVTEVIDRNYFHSIYYREPGGVLFELATDNPGFDVDEPMNALGQKLQLPEWLERRRADISAQLPDLGV
jgi:glyoxalase family protein